MSRAIVTVQGYFNLARLKVKMGDWFFAATGADALGAQHR